VADLAAKRGFASPAVTVVGEVVKLRSELNWYEALPLFGQRVVVTRTRRQASTLTERLRRLGADVLEISTIRIVPVALSGEQRGKLAAFSRHFDWVIFTSPNAVDLFFAEFFQLGCDVRELSGVRIAAVGPATAKKLEELHLRVDLQPEVYMAGKLAEAFPEKAVTSARFCLPHGRRADRLPAEHLRERGGVVEEWTLYDTQPEEEDPTGARARYLREGAHWITFTSSSTAENWHALGLAPAPGAPVPEAVSMGPVTSATLNKLGGKPARESAASTLDSLVETLVELSLESRHANE
jgi:uroporphyrinogen III methyltransferase/synthase